MSQRETDTEKYKAQVEYLMNEQSRLLELLDDKDDKIMRQEAEKDRLNAELYRAVGHVTRLLEHSYGDNGGPIDLARSDARAFLSVHNAGNEE